MEIIHRKATAVVASLVLLGAAVSLWRTFRSSTGKIDVTPAISLGQILAGETAQVMHDRGRVVPVVAAYHLQPDHPLFAEWDAFRNELKQHGAITLAAPEIVAADPNDPQPMGVGCPIAKFKELLEQHGQADALVFFVGLPLWYWLQERDAIPPAVTCKIIVVDTGAMLPKQHYEPYFKNGILSELIIGWGGSPGQVAQPKTPREWFDKYFQIVTPQNYESLPQ